MKNKISVVLDTDTYNEIDDQFALSYLTKCDKEFNLEAIYAAPFTNDRSKSAKEGMEKSFAEIEILLNKLNRTDIPFFKGATYYLNDKFEPEKNEAVLDLLNRAKAANPKNPLYIIAIGAITNIAQACLIDNKTMIENCKLIWLGGHHPNWPHNLEFNFMGDIKAVEIVFNSKIELTVVPCLGVSSHLTTSKEELSNFLNLEDSLSNFLFQRFCDYFTKDMITKEIWDIAAVAILTLPNCYEAITMPCPRVANDGSYILDPRRHSIKMVYHLNRDMIFNDLYTKLSHKENKK